MLCSGHFRECLALARYVPRARPEDSGNVWVCSRSLAQACRALHKTLRETGESSQHSWISGGSSGHSGAPTTSPERPEQIGGVLSYP